MPPLKSYSIFISHAWNYGYSYERLVQMLNSAPNFRYKNYSAPSDHPLRTLKNAEAASRAQIAAAINRKISLASCVVVLSGMYAARREWMRFEIESAIDMNKPIIAIVPRGGERIPQYIQDCADIVVHWNTQSIVSAIREYSL